MDATSLASMWALIALILFIVAAVWLKAPKSLAKALDDRAERIRNELDEARALREEAQQLLADYQRKRKEAEQEARELVTAAQREAEAIISEAKAKSEEYVARRTALAEQKIAQAEQEAVNEVRASAVTIASAAAARLIRDKMDDAAAAEQFKASLAEVKARLN